MAKCLLGDTGSGTVVLKVGRKTCFCGRHAPRKIKGLFLSVDPNKVSISTK